MVRGVKRSLLARARAGDRQALVRLVRRHQQALAGYLWALGAPRASLEPLLIETFVRAFDQLAPTTPLRRGLFAIATRLAFQHGLPEQRCLLVLCCLEGFSYSEVAQMLDLPVATVRAKVRRAKSAFR